MNTTNRETTQALALHVSSATTTTDNITTPTSGTSSGGSRAAASQGRAVPCGGGAATVAGLAGRAGSQTAKPAAMYAVGKAVMMTLRNAMAS